MMIEVFADNGDKGIFLLSEVSKIVQSGKVIMFFLKHTDAGVVTQQYETLLECNQVYENLKKIMADM